MQLTAVGFITTIVAVTVVITQVI